MNADFLLLVLMVGSGCIGVAWLLLGASRRHDREVKRLEQNARLMHLYDADSDEPMSPDVLKAEREYEQAKVEYVLACKYADQLQMRIRVADAIRLGKRWRNGTMVRPEYPDLSSV